LNSLSRFLAERAPGDLSPTLSAIADGSFKVKRALPLSIGNTMGLNPSGERQTKIDVYANDIFVSSLLSTGAVAEIASEEMSEAKKGKGRVHVTMDPIDGSSNISTNNPLGSIFGFYSSRLPCSGAHLVGAAFVTYGPMLTLTFSVGRGVHSFVAVEGDRGSEFLLADENIAIPEKAEVYGFGGQRKDWIEPVGRFVSSLEARGLKLRYGGSFVGDCNQVLRYGGIFGYPALKDKPRGKLRVLYEAAPMAFIMKQCGGYSSDGSRDALAVVPRSLAESTPIYLGSPALVREVEALVGRG